MSNPAKQFITEKDTIYELDQECLRRKYQKRRQAADSTPSGIQAKKQNLTNTVKKA